MSRPDRAVAGLRTLAERTSQAVRDHGLLAYVRAAQHAIDRSPGVDQLLRDYTDAMFRNTETILDDLEATAR